MWCIFVSKLGEFQSVTEDGIRNSELFVPFFIFQEQRNNEGRCLQVHKAPQICISIFFANDLNPDGLYK